MLLFAEASAAEYRYISNDTLPTSVPRRTVAYAVSVSKDGNFFDGAAVLGWSIIQAHRESNYDVALVAIVHKNAVVAKRKFEWLTAHGMPWWVMVRDLPISVADIPNKLYRERLPKSGCCGELELLKLWAWSLTEYHRVVHLDMDSLVLQNIDELYAIDKDIVYTEDWLMASKGTKVAPAQGGFLLIRPSTEIFDHMTRLVQEGDWRGGKGAWGGSGIGFFYGGPTIQGFVPYFFKIVRPGTSMIVERCVYNNMADNPYWAGTQDCRDKTPGGNCSDCRKWPITNVKNTHFTICQKPWNCVLAWHGLCSQLHQKWFDIRLNLEQHLLGTYPKGDSNRPKKEALRKRYGFCSTGGKGGYVPIPARPD